MTQMRVSIAYGGFRRSPIRRRIRRRGWGGVLPWRLPCRSPPPIIADERQKSKEPAEVCPLKGPRRKRRGHRHPRSRNARRKRRRVPEGRQPRPAPASRPFPELPGRPHRRGDAAQFAALDVLPAGMRGRRGAPRPNRRPRPYGRRHPGVTLPPPASAQNFYRIIATYSC